MRTDIYFESIGAGHIGRRTRLAATAGRQSTRRVFGRVCEAGTNPVCDDNAKHGDRNGHGCKRRPEHGRHAHAPATAQSAQDHKRGAAGTHTSYAETENKPATQKRAQHIRVHIIYSTTRTHRELVGFADEEGSSPSTAPYAIAETLFFFFAVLHILRFTSKRTLFI